MAEELSWTAWSVLDGFPKLAARSLAELLDGGQAFRWNPAADGVWRGIWSNHVVELKTGSDGRLRWRTPEIRGAGVTAVQLRSYLDVDPAFEQRMEVMPWRSDPHLARCIESFPGLRILRQPFDETLLCFLCSATKQIVQIKQIVELLAKRLGRELAPGFFRLPNWTELASVSEAELRACLLGFRARYIHETAQFLAGQPGWLAETQALPYAEAKARLCLLPGVGEKVADCVLLFGAGRMEAFPVDVWIIKTMARRYGLESWKPVQIAHFGRVHFGANAGLAQQFLFAWERETAKKK